MLLDDSMRWGATKYSPPLVNILFCYVSSTTRPSHRLNFPPSPHKMDPIASRREFDVFIVSLAILVKYALTRNTLCVWTCSTTGWVEFIENISYESVTFLFACLCALLSFASLPRLRLCFFLLLLPLSVECCSFILANEKYTSMTDSFSRTSDTATLTQVDWTIVSSHEISRERERRTRQKRKKKVSSQIN